MLISPGSIVRVGVDANFACSGKTGAGSPGTDIFLMHVHFAEATGQLTVTIGYCCSGHGLC